MGSWNVTQKEPVYPGTAVQRLRLAFTRLRTADRVMEQTFVVRL
jgi:hypothetical protein